MSLVNTFPLAGIIPADDNWGGAKRISVKLPASVTYAKGTVLGEVAGANEVQTVTLASTTASGTFTLTYAGQTTAAIAYDATAATVQSALEALSNVGANNVSVSGSAGGPWTITFQNTLGKQNVAEMTADSTSLGGTNEVQTVTLTNAAGGTFTLTYAGQTTGAIAYDATAGTVDTALEALSNIGAGDVAVTGSAGGPYTVTFTSALAATNVAEMTASGASLTGTNEVQRITITGTPTGGDFTLTYAGQTTAPIAFDADAATVDAALEALSNIGPGDVTCGGGPLPDSFVTVTFTGTLASTNVAQMTADGTGLTGGTAPAIAITTTTPGLAPSVAVVTATAGGPGTATPATVTAGAAATSGTYKAYLSSSTDGSEVAKAILEFDSATDASGNITLGGASGGGDKQQLTLGNTVPVFVSGDFRTEDLLQTAGAGQLTEAAVASLGKLVYGSVTKGLLRIG